MDGWWSEIEEEILSHLERHDELTPSELGRHLGMSASSTASLLAILASEGKVSITVSRAVAPMKEKTAHR